MPQKAQLAILIAKIIGIVMLFAIALISAIYPMWGSTGQRKFRLNMMLFGIANVFAAGIFGGVALMRFLPETSIILFQEFETTHSKEIAHFPWGSLTALGGYFLSLLIERVATRQYRVDKLLVFYPDAANAIANENAMHNNFSQPSPRTLGNALLQSEVNIAPSGNIGNPFLMESQYLKFSEFKRSADSNYSSNNMGNTAAATSVQQQRNRFASEFGVKQPENKHAQMQTSFTAMKRKESFSESVVMTGGQGRNAGNEVDEERNYDVQSQSDITQGEQVQRSNYQDDYHNGLHHTSQYHQQGSSHRKQSLGEAWRDRPSEEESAEVRLQSRQLNLLMVLCYRSIIEGLALGLQNQLPTFLYLCIVMVLVKWVQAMQLTALMVQGQTKRSTFFQFTVTFALCTPCALALGWFFAAAGSLLWAFTLAFVSGAFFYIAFSEVIVEEISPWWNQDRGLKVCMLFFSLLIVAGFAFAEENLKNIT